MFKILKLQTTKKSLSHLTRHYAAWTNKKYIVKYKCSKGPIWDAWETRGFNLAPHSERWHSSESLLSIWMCSYLSLDISNIHVESVSPMKALANPHLQLSFYFKALMILYLLQRLIFTEENPGSPSLSAPSFAELPSQFSSLHSQSACVLLLTPAAAAQKKKRRCASLTEASHWLFQLIVSRTLSSPSS